MATITKTKVFKRLDFDTIYAIRIRTHWRNETGEWGEYYYYKTMGEDDIPAPTNVSLNFDKKESDKHVRWKAIVIWDEVTMPDCRTLVDEYIVQLWRWDPKTNTLKDTEWEKRKKVPATDDDNNSIAKAKFFPVSKKSWWVARVRAVVDGVKGPYSDFCFPGSPQDTEPPPTPLNVTIHRGVNRIITTWDEPSEFIVLNGTVSASSGTNTLTGLGTSFETEVGAGVYIRVGQEIKTVTSVSSATSLTVDTNWANSYNNVIFEVDLTEDNISRARIQMSQDINFETIIDKDMHVTSQKHSFKAEDDVPYYTRVSFVDSSGVVCKWVPATHAGNSNPNAQAEGRKPKNLEQMATFTASGSLSVKSYNHRWYADHDYEIKSVSISVGTMPAGNSIKVNIQLNGDNIFASDDRPCINPGGDHRDRSSSIKSGKTTIEDGDYLTISVDSVGSSTSGSDLVAQVRMERIN